MVLSDPVKSHFHTEREKSLDAKKVTNFQINCFDKKYLDSKKIFEIAA